jgi:hypothetical protein
MANRIFTRSPFNVTVTGTANQETSCELFIWNGTYSSSAPATATRTLSKKIPSSVVTTVNYNISSYIREYISFRDEPQIYNTVSDVNSVQFCNVIVKLYLAGVLQSTTTYVALDGYGYYEDDYNPSLSTCMLTPGTYYYNYDSTGLVSDTALRPGHLTIDGESTWTVLYTDLVSAATQSTALVTTMLRKVYRVYPTYWANGNKVEVKNGAGTVQATYYFRPIEECKYDVYYLDFINRYGAWQKEFLFKASKQSIETRNTEYNLMSSSYNYNPADATKAVMNANGNESIKCNTGWVDEAFGTNTMRELLLSERILLNGKPVKLKTKGIEIQKHINEKLINYAIEFDYAYDMINNVV